MTIEDFRDGIRILILLQRVKDGGHNRPDYHAHKRLVNGREQYEKELDRLRQLRASKEDPSKWRIYSSVNRRNIEKGIRNFKQDMLEADYYDEASRHQFYMDITNRWHGAIMKPNTATEKRFLIDVDYNEGDSKDAAQTILELVTTILLDYPTTNGHHFIVEPYNPALTPELEVKKDALIYVE